MNYEAVFRTAPATPGLFKITQPSEPNHSKKELLHCPMYLTLHSVKKVMSRVPFAVGAIIFSVQVYQPLASPEVRGKFSCDEDSLSVGKLGSRGLRLYSGSGCYYSGLESSRVE